MFMCLFLSRTFCQTPFAGLLLRHGNSGEIRSIFQRNIRDENLKNSGNFPSSCNCSDVTRCESTKNRVHALRGRTLQGGVLGTFWKPPSQNTFCEPFSEPSCFSLSKTIVEKRAPSQNPSENPSPEPFPEPSQNPSLNAVLLYNPLGVHHKSSAIDLVRCRLLD